jgi:hypothetical protein
VGDLIPDPRNARTHPKRQIEQLRASIEAFGFTNPILADPESRIIAGHGRLQAARAMGLGEVPTITLSGLSETQKRALRIADNQIALNAGWDLEILQKELGDLASIDIDIDPTLTGFSTGEIDVILSSTADPDDEVIPAVPTTPRTRPGEIWILGEHRVGCGDGRDAGFMQRVLGDGARADAAFLDPPYNVRIGGHAVAAGSHREFAMASGAMRGSRREDLTLHRTVKPTGLVADALQDVTRHGDLVLDLFLGPGTTLLAAERIGRRLRGLDIDPAYVDVAIERWSARTGLEPRLEVPAP